MVTVLFGTMMVVLTAPLPFYFDGSRLCAWILTWMCRIFLVVANVNVAPYDRKRIRAHQGFVFANHQSYLEVIILFSIRPYRALAKAEIQQMPIASTLAKRIGTLFVKRESKESRMASRQMLAQAGANPPIMLFPEGKILLDFALQPFRHGAFQVAIDSGMPYLPIAFLYDPSEVARWVEDSIMLDFWKMLHSGSTINARVVLGDTVYAGRDDSAAQLANEMWQWVSDLYQPTIPNPERIALVLPKS